MAWLAHDLRAPLDRLRSSLDALGLSVPAALSAASRTRPDPVAWRRHHRDLEHAAEELSALVDDLVALSRPGGPADSSPGGGSEPGEARLHLTSRAAGRVGPGFDADSAFDLAFAQDQPSCDSEAAG